jgi:hypothetical protein
VKDYHERQYADTQTAGEKDSQLSSSENGQLPTAAVPQLSSTAGGHHDDDRLEIAKDGLGLILERSDKQLLRGQSTYLSFWVSRPVLSRFFKFSYVYFVYTVYTERGERFYLCVSLGIQGYSVCTPLT